jgi:hypothetical protein
MVFTGCEHATPIGASRFLFNKNQVLDQLITEHRKFVSPKEGGPVLSHVM